MNIISKFKKIAESISTRGIAKFICVASAMLILSSHPSAAQDFGGVTTFLDAVVDAITGEIGVAVSSLAVMAVGFMFMTGRMDWTHAVAVILGIAIVFGAASFVDGLSAN